MSKARISHATLQRNGKVSPLGPDSAAARPRASRSIERLVEAVQRQSLARHIRRRRFGRCGDVQHDGQAQPLDVLIATGREPHVPDEIFPRLRWGGLFAYVAERPQSVQRLAEAYDKKRGFVLEQPPTHIWHAPLGLRLPPLASRGYYFVARKSQLVQPGDLTDRFTYHVELVRHASSPDGYVVRKAVPSVEHLHWRLCQKYPQHDQADLLIRARRLVERIFPTFLTREASFLKRLQRDLPPEYRCRVPEPLHIDTDERGLVRELYMNWLRHRTEPIDQLTFARQSTDLLTALHEHVGIMHLDLRLDNVVLSEHGVAFVDFGSAVRIGEQLQHNNTLGPLFDEMMQTSQIQRMLGRMLERGEITNQVIRDVHGKVDKTVDVFYLAVQINQVHRHPELRHLVHHEPESRAADLLQRLTAAVLRPINPDKAAYKTAADLLRGIDRIERKLHQHPTPPSLVATLQ